MNNIESYHPDSSEYQVKLLREEGAKHMDDFRKQSKNEYFQKAKVMKVAPPKGNVPRIKQKIQESEDDPTKQPGCKYIKDMLRATAYYTKESK